MFNKTFSFHLVTHENVQYTTLFEDCALKVKICTVYAQFPRDLVLNLFLFDSFSTHVSLRS